MENEYRNAIIGISSKPSVPRSGSHKCLRFGFWLTLRTVNNFIYLLIYLRTFMQVTE